MQAFPLCKSGSRRKSENGFQWVLASTCCCVWAPSVTTGQSKPLLPQSLIPMTTTSLMKEAQLVMSRSSGVIQSTSTKLDDVWTVLHALYWKRMTKAIAPMMRYLILYALECKRMKMPPMYRNAYLSPRHHGRKKIPWLPFHPATTSNTT